MKVWVFVTLGMFGLGFFAGDYRHKMAMSSEPRLTCRPSDPTQFDGQPAVLFWGNSLAFDNDWDIDGVLSVNCASQGLTAKAATNRTSALPHMDFTAIIIVFGTVELMRNFDDPAAFETYIGEIISALKQNYPHADLMTLGVARDRISPTVWAYERQPHLDAVNLILQRLEGVTFIDTTEILGSLPTGTETYDGVHFSRQSYRLLEDAIHQLLIQ